MSLLISMVRVEALHEYCMTAFMPKQLQYSTLIIVLVLKSTNKFAYECRNGDIPTYAF